MSFIRVTDNADSGTIMFYLYNQISPLVARLNGKAEISCQDKRCELKVCIDKNFVGFIRSEIEDRIADVVAVSYKYQYFKQKVKVGGLDNFKTELLLSALICADLEEDKRYVSAKMSRFDEYSIDGTFNFRMNSRHIKYRYP